MKPETFLLRPICEGKNIGRQVMKKIALVLALLLTLVSTGSAMAEGWNREVYPARPVVVCPVRPVVLPLRRVVVPRVVYFHRDHRRYEIRRWDCR